MSNRRKWTTEEKAAIVLEVLTTKTPMAEVCRKHNLSHTQFYDWKEKFLKGGRKALETGRNDRETAMERQIDELKQLVAELTIANSALKKVMGVRS